MNRRDLGMISGIAILLLAAVAGFELMLRGVPEIAPGGEKNAVKPSLSVRSRSNVRAGDSTNHRILGKLQAGDSATILGISQGSAGWYYIELPYGTRGFISPDLVTTEGDLTNLETIDPASLSATATPLAATAQSTQPAATAVVTEQPDDAQPPAPTPSG